MSILRAVRSIFSPSSIAEAPPEDRRQFFRRAAGVGLGVAAGGMLIPDDAWAAVEERANRFGIKPGTVVDAMGRPVAAGAQGTSPFLGEIAMFGFNFPPRDWARCDGQLLAINSNQALFSLLGTYYGGDGRNTFGLPDLRGRFPTHQGQGPGLANRTMGSKSGSERVTLAVSEIPSHAHGIEASTLAGTTDAPAGAVAARPASSIPQYATTADGQMAATMVAGGGQPHENMPPFLTINFCISLLGQFPSRN